MSNYTFRGQRNGGGYDIVKLGNDFIYNTVKTRYKAEREVRRLNISQRPTFLVKENKKQKSGVDSFLIPEKDIKKWRFMAEFKLFRIGDLMQEMADEYKKKPSTCRNACLVQIKDLTQLIKAGRKSAIIKSKRGWE